MKTWRCEEVTAKEYLSQAYHLDQRIASKLEMVESLDELATRCTSTLTGMPHNPSKSVSPMADAVMKIIDLKDEINRDFERLVNLKREISFVIREVDYNEYRMILEKRYISNKTWPEIAVELGYNLRHLYRLHDAALNKVKIPEDVTKCHY
jgi:DNA-directed RNA polymerase specialized sigma subunit